MKFTPFFLASMAVVVSAANAQGPVVEDLDDDLMDADDESELANVPLLSNATKPEERGGRSYPVDCASGSVYRWANSGETYLSDTWYSNNYAKCYIIDAGHNNRVQFRLDYMSTEGTYDVLEFYNIPSFSSHSKRRFKQLHGRKTSGTYKSSGRYMMIQLKTDHSVTDYGFRGYFKSIPKVFGTGTDACFQKIGSGYCRDSWGGQGSYRTRCRAGSPCSWQTCANLCKGTWGCTGIEFWEGGSKSGVCEVHTSWLADVKRKRDRSCWRYVC